MLSHFHFSSFGSGALCILLVISGRTSNKNFTEIYATFVGGGIDN